MPKGMTSKTIVRSVDLDEIERQLREIAKSAAQNQSKSRAAGRLDPHFAQEVPSPQAAPESDGRAGRFPLDVVAEVPDEDAAERPVARRRLRAPLMIAVPVLAIVCGIGTVMAMRPNILSTGLLGRSIATSGGDGPAAASPAAVTAAPPAAAKPADQPEQAAKASADGQGGAKPEAAQEASLAASSPVTAPAASAPTPVALAPALATPVASASPGSAPTVSAPAAATPAPAQASVTDVPPAAAQAAVFGKPRRVATVSVKHEADAVAPAADPSQGAADTALFGTPRRVTSFSVKPDGSVAPSQGGAPPAPKVASTDAKSQPAPAPAQSTPTPAAKPHADAARPKPKPSSAANRRQTGQAALSILPPAGAAAAPQDPPPQATQSAAQPSRGNPLAGVANGFHRVLEITHIVGPADQSQ